MPTDNKTEQYYNLLEQHVSTFSTVSCRERLPLSCRIRPLAWGGQRGQGWRIFELLFQVPCQSQHRLVLCSYSLGSFSGYAAVQKDFPSDCSGKSRGEWRRIKELGGRAHSDNSCLSWGMLIISSWKVCLGGSDLWCWSYLQSLSCSLK